VGQDELLERMKYYAERWELMERDFPRPQQWVDLSLDELNSRMGRYPLIGQPLPPFWAKAAKSPANSNNVNPEEMKSGESIQNNDGHQSDLAPAVPNMPRLPYLLADGTLVIPFDSPVRFHWWKKLYPEDGILTLSEVRAAAAATGQSRV
jgi:hypothetical protein